LHLFAIAVVGVEEIGAHEQKDDLRGLQLVSDLFLPVGAGADVGVVPDVDEAHFLKGMQVALETFEERAVCMGVAAADAQVFFHGVLFVFLPSSSLQEYNRDTLLLTRSVF
jgi:hypothetical protein